ncbi:hypothetical protein CHUAL_006948 [Chamberlinius hualienensis]
MTALILTFLFGIIAMTNGVPLGHKMAAYTGVVARPEKLTVMRQPNPSAQYHAQDELGQYSYGYSSADGQAKAEIKGIDGSIAGKYSYIDAHGKRVEVSYVADKNGFRAVGDHLPKGVPNMPVELAKAYDEANQRLAFAHSQIKETKEEESSKQVESNGKEEEEEAAVKVEESEEEEEEEEESEGGEEGGEGSEGSEGGEGESEKAAVSAPAHHQHHAAAPAVGLPLHQQSFVVGITADGRYAVAPVTFAAASHNKFQPQIQGAYIASHVPQKVVHFAQPQATHKVVAPAPPAPAPVPIPVQVRVPMTMTAPHKFFPIHNSQFQIPRQHLVIAHPIPYQQHKKH